MPRKPQTNPELMEIFNRLLPGLLVDGKPKMTIKFTENVRPEKIATVSLGKPFNWFVAFEWLIKLEWDSKYKINQPRRFRDSIKPQGILLSKYLKLTERVCFFSSESELGFCKDSGAFFRAIFYDLMALAISETTNPPPTKIRYNNRKDAELLHERKRLADLRNFKNPYLENPKTRHLALLTERAIFLADKSDRFREGYWNPFWRAYSAWIKEMNSERWGRPVIKNGKYYIHFGRGKHEEFIVNTEQYNLTQKIFYGSTLSSLSKNT